MLTSLRCRPGDSCAVAGKGAFQQLGGRRRKIQRRTGQRVLLAVCGEHDVDVVFDTSLGEHCVEQLPGLLARDDPVHDVGGETLGSEDGRGVAEPMCSAAYDAVQQRSDGV